MNAEDFNSPCAIEENTELSWCITFWWGQPDHRTTAATLHGMWTGLVSINKKPTPQIQNIAAEIYFLRDLVWTKNNLAEELPTEIYTNRSY